MATERIQTQLSGQQIVRLAASIPANNMVIIAEGYMGITNATVKNKKFENRDDAEAFNRDIIRRWAYEHPENQVQVITAKFCFHKCLSVHRWGRALVSQHTSHFCIQGEGGLHPGGSEAGKGGSASGGRGLHLGILHPGGSASGEVCIERVCIRGGGSASRGSASRRGGLHLGVLHPGGSSASGEVCIQGFCIGGGGQHPRGRGSASRGGGSASPSEIHGYY